ncbi:MAG TPA: UDP-N-acetylmuramoyl-L-alanine--D-glutamate ligase [bacterium]|nr:UDP-N-acetylmuramoyl-L-alanine--D-glutamate ligase [bacterium]
MLVAGKRFIVVGLGVTGRACAKFLSGGGADVSVTDVREDLSGVADAIEEIRANGAGFITPDAVCNERFDALVLSPGLAPDDPRVEPLIAAAGEWMSEIELAYRLSTGKILAITGSNGKTTVTTLLGDILKAGFDDVRVVGNIGNTFIESIAGSDEKTMFVAEISSYQLEGCFEFKPDVAIVLNVQPDHLLRHGTMENYADVKSRILMNMDSNGAAVLNADDMYVKEMGSRTRAKVLMVGTEGKRSPGGWVEGDRLMISVQGKDMQVGRTGEMNLKGGHNLFNALSASIAAYLAGVPVEKISGVISGFTGLEHRIESIGEVNEVECVDDSKATNPDASIAALKTYGGRDITILLGGDDKGFDYGLLYEEIGKAGARVIVFGPGLMRVAEEIERENMVECKRAAGMKEAVALGLEITPAGGVLLLSPGSSSFDSYRNFEERGKDFKSEVGKKKKTS